MLPEAQELVESLPRQRRLRCGELELPTALYLTAHEEFSFCPTRLISYDKFLQRPFLRQTSLTVFVLADHNPDEQSGLFLAGIIGEKGSDWVFALPLGGRVSCWLLIIWTQSDLRYPIACSSAVSAGDLASLASRRSPMRCSRCPSAQFWQSAKFLRPSSFVAPNPAERDCAKLVCGVMPNETNCRRPHESVNLFPIGSSRRLWIMGDVFRP
jgi:hypothetical protein